MATERLNEENTRIDRDAQPNATLDVTLPHSWSEKEISVVCVEQREGIGAGSLFPYKKKKKERRKRLKDFI